jgi:murein DD-endopeptidase MepM/ murein hydrolase activator NlpD
VRTLAIRPAVVIPTVALLAVLLTGYIGATAYLVFRDDLVGAAVSRQVSMQYAYEERIAALRSELDRLTSRHAVQTVGVEEQLSTLLEQQATIAERQAALDKAMKRAQAVGVEVAPAQASPDLQPAEDGTPSDGDSDSAGGPLSYMPEEHSAGQDAIATILRSSSGSTVSTPASRGNIRPLLAEVRESVEGTEADLSKTLEALDTAAQNHEEKISTALARIGVVKPEDDSAEGGPFVPATGLHYVERAALLGRTLDEIDALQQTASALPLGMPVNSNRVSSRFGMRRDPFLFRPAFHAGLDFVAPAGSTVHATAAGTVVSAGWSGGYGQMIEVRHANGLSTRYGHLSVISVGVGAKVAAGSPIGLVGSTGRSTGPHLHYETRRDGNAIDPTLYIAVGRALRAPSGPG